MFGGESITARFNERKTYDLNLFCYCSMPKCSDYMVQCELCEEWLHMSCEGLKAAPEGEWLCTVCRPPTLNVFVIVKVLFRIPRQLIIVKI